LRTPCNGDFFTQDSRGGLAYAIREKRDMLMINSVTATITVGTNPSAISINPSTNTVYVANQNTNTVSVIDGKTNSVTAIPIKL
jgi:YVTN family beta-propeller protein